MEGRVVAAHGRQYLVELTDGTLLPCFPRGKKSDVACGDRVEVLQASADQGVIEAILPRTSLLYRSNDIRQKLIAANVDQVVLVVATEPAFSDELVTRTLLATESEEIEALIVLNKCDLAANLPAARERLADVQRARLPGARTLRPRTRRRFAPGPAWPDQRADRTIRHGQINVGQWPDAGGQRQDP
jgi:putative ribosome biogenesis GTPase RsgA